MTAEASYLKIGVDAGLSPHGTIDDLVRRLDRNGVAHRKTRLHEGAKDPSAVIELVMAAGAARAASRLLVEWLRRPRAAAVVLEVTIRPDETRTFRFESAAASAKDELDIIDAINRIAGPDGSAPASHPE